MKPFTARFSTKMKWGNGGHLCNAGHTSTAPDVVMMWHTCSGWSVVPENLRENLASFTKHNNGELCTYVTTRHSRHVRRRGRSLVGGVLWITSRWMETDCPAHLAWLAVKYTIMRDTASCPLEAGTGFYVISLQIYHSTMLCSITPNNRTCYVILCQIYMWCKIVDEKHPVQERSCL